MSLFRHNDYVKWMSSYVTVSLNQARSESALAATIYISIICAKILKKHLEFPLNRGYQQVYISVFYIFKSNLFCINTSAPQKEV